MNIFFFKKRRIPTTTLQLFTRQLAILLDARLPLGQALTVLAEQESNAAFKKTLSALIENIQSGNTLSEALAGYPSLFSSLYINMIRAGEMSSTLSTVLSRLVSFQEQIQKMKQKITSMLLYPAIVLIAALLMIFFLGGMIIPKFEIIFADGFEKNSLPSCTLFLLEASQYIRNHIMTMILLLIAFLVAIKFAFTLEAFCEFFDRLFLGLPLIGNVLKKHYISQCFYTLGTLILHNVPPLEAIQITQKISNNRAIEKAMKMIHQSLEAGDSIMYPLQASHLFPPMAMSIIAIGEHTGRLAEMLLQVATIYEQDVHHRITQLMILIEPCLILLLACFVGGVVIALFLPLMTMIGSIGN